MTFRNHQSSSEYLEYLKLFIPEDKLSMPEDAVPCYAQYDRYSPNYLEKLSTSVLLYPCILMNSTKDLEKKRQIKYECNIWVSHLKDNYLQSGINCNSLIRFVDWSLHYACELVGLNLPSNVQVGTLPIATMNIHCAPIEANTYCILIDPSCMAILESYSRQIFSDKLYTEIGSELSNKIKSYFTDSIGYSFDEVIFDATNPKLEEYKAFLFIHTLYFALLHEYAHILNNHVSLNNALMVDQYEKINTEKEKYFFYYLTGIESFNIFFKNTFQEFEADAWASYYLTKIVHIWSNNEEILLSKISMGAPILFLGILQAFETSYIASGHPIMDRHPAAFDRLTIPDLVLDTLNEGFTDEIRKFIGSHVNSVIYRLSDSTGATSISDKSVWWPIFDFLLTLDENLLIPEILYTCLDEWENPNLRVIEKTIEEFKRRTRS
jgi:hypothetical protein